MHLEDKSPALAELTDAQREQAMTRFRVLRSHVERGVALPRAAQAAGVGLQTVERWLARYRADGLTGLVRRTREDRGRRRLPVEAVELIEGLFLKKPRPSAAAVYRRVLTLCKERQWASPSYSTVYAIISGLDPGLIMLAHEGPARFSAAPRKTVKLGMSADEVKKSLGEAPKVVDLGGARDVSGASVQA